MIDTEEIYWYEELIANRVIIGLRGGPEYVVSKWELAMAEDKAMIRKGRRLTPKEMLMLAKRESEYIDYEVVKPEIKLLNK